MSELDAVKSANDAYAAQFTKGDLPRPPARRFAVITCMDARIDPAKALGLEEGDANVFRNAGGIATDDALRSLVISRMLLGTQEAFVIGHTDCGMVSFTNDQLRDRLRDELGADAGHVDFEPFPDVHGSVAASVRRLRESDLVPDDYRITGFVYDVKTGRIEEVPA
ncbi:MAG TPA: carbonic anhydrase [Gaiellaceae bacterium]|nr:carbonic anhydrase [Gaiellaceae bacterium]